MGNQWNSWEGRRVGRARPRSFAPPSRRPLQQRGLTKLQLAAGLAAVAAAGGFGATWSLIERDRGGGGWSSAPIEWNAVQAVPRPVLDADDTAWMKRGEVADASAESTPGGAASSAGAVRARFGLCHSGGGTNCVVDGDTLWIGGENVRLADIDAPETHEPRCAGEQALGDRATRRLHGLVNSGAVTLHPIGRDRDRYGRKLRIVAVGGTSVGDTLVGEGLARWYQGGRRSWCG